MAMQQGRALQLQQRTARGTAVHFRLVVQLAEAGGEVNVCRGFFVAYR